MPYLRSTKQMEAYTKGLNAAYAKGIQARAKGEPRSSNPYKRFEHQSLWFQGYDKPSNGLTK